VSSFLKEWQKNLQIGIKYLGQGNPADAEEYFRICAEEAETNGIPIIIAFSQRLLATAQLRNNKIDEAEKGFYKALKYCQILKNYKGIAEAKAGLAGILYVRRQYRQSADLYKEAISIYPTDSSHLRLAVLYADLAQVYTRLKNWDKAKESFARAWSLCRGYGYHKGEAEINLYLGEIYYSQGKIKEAEEKFKEASGIFLSLGDELCLANALQYIGFISLEKNELEEALLNQYRVIAIFLKHGRYSEVSESYYLLSNILQCAKLMDEVEDTLRLSLRYYQGHEFGLAVRYHGLAVAAIMKKEYDEAKKNYYQALKYYQLFGDGSKIGEICEELTFLLKYEDSDSNDNLYKWVGFRSPEMGQTKYEVMLNLANSLKSRGNYIAALRCGWKALEIAKIRKYDTLEIEVIIQDISERIRKKSRWFI